MNTSQLVIVQPFGNRTEELRSVLRQWSSTGLFDRMAFVVGPVDEESQLRGVRVELMGFDGAAIPDATLDGALGPRFDTVRLVVVQLVEGGPQPEVFWSASALRGLLIRHLGQTELVALNLIVPCLGAEGPSPLRAGEHTMPGWAANVVVSPEDRVTPEAADRGVPPDVLAGHAALALSIAGAWWRGVEAGPFDAEMGTPLQWAALRTMRCFAGVVDGDPIVDDIAESVLLLSRVGEDDCWPEPADSVTQERLPQLPRDQAAARMDALAEHAMSACDGSLSFHDLAPPGHPGEKEVGFREAFRWYVDFLLGRALSMPRGYGAGLAARTREQLERLATSSLFGAESEVVVTFGGRPRRGTPPPFSFDRQEDLLQRAQGVLGEVPDPPFAPALWADLRDVCFGIVDGAPLPSGWPWRSIQSDRPVVTWPGEIVPHPRSRLTVGVDQLRLLGYAAEAPLPLGACDALTAFRVVAALRTAKERGAQVPVTPVADSAEPCVDGFDEPDGGEVSADTGGAPSGILPDGAVPTIWLGDALPVAPVVLEDLPDAVPGPVDGTGAVPDETAPIALGDEAPPDEQVRIGEHQIGGGGLDGLEAALMDWAKERRSSLMYRIAERVGAEITQAEHAMFEARELIRNPPLDPTAPRSDKQARWLASAGVVGLLVFVWAGVSDKLAMGLAVAIGFIWLLVCLGAGIVRVYRKVNLHFRELYRRPPAQALADWAVDRLRRAVNELARLQHQYQVLMEWADIVGHLLHEPFVRPDQAPVDDPFRKLDATPDALTILRAGRSPVRDAALRSRSRNLVFEERWMHSLYQRVEETMLEDFKRAAGLAPEARARTPVEEIGHRSMNSRAFLRDQLLSGKIGRTAWVRTVHHLGERIGELPLRELYDEFDHEGTRTAEQASGRDVRSIEEFLQSLEPGASPLRLSMAVLNAEGRGRVGSRAIDVYLALPSKVTVDRRRATVVEAPTVLAPGADFWTIGLRADLAEPFTVGWCGLFGADEEHQRGSSGEGVDRQDREVL